ncbi:MAG: hypothetical protein ACKVP5_11400 [Aestuariivirga sp.]
MMSDSMPAKVEPAAEAKAPKPEAAKANGRAKKVDSETAKKKPKKAPKDFEFTGRVEGININGTDAPGSQFLFSLVNKKGEHRSYTLDASNAARFSAMACLISAAYAKDAKVHVNSAPSAGPTLFAGEIEVRAKP